MNESADNLQRPAEQSPPASSPGDDAPKAQPLRVAWVAAPGTLERLERVLGPLATGLLDVPIELTVICPQDAQTAKLPSPPLEFVRYDQRRWLGVSRKTAELLGGRLRKANIQLIHALDAGAAGFARQLARLAQTPCVVSVDRVGEGRKLGSLETPVVGALAGSEAVRRDLLDNRKLPAGRIHRVRPGVHAAEWANCFSVPGRSVAVVACGDMDAFGPFGAVVNAFAELRSRNYDCAFFAIGEGKARRRLRKLCETLHLRGALVFADPQRPSQLAGILKGADICICPRSTREVNMPGLLAMAAGICVMAGGAGASDFLIEGQTAMLFEPGNSAELAFKLAALLGDPRAARSLADGGLAYLHEHHSPAGMVQNVLDVYGWALGEGAQGA